MIYLYRFAALVLLIAFLDVAFGRPIAVGIVAGLVLIVLGWAMLRSIERDSRRPGR